MTTRTSVTYIADPYSMHHAFRAWTGMTGRWLYGKVLKTTAIAVATSPVKTGHLKGSIVPMRGSWGKEMEGRVVALPKHAKYVIGGTQPHTIVPTTPGGRLVFYWPKAGTVVAFRKVRHPGQEANNFMVKALKKGV